MDMGFRLSRLGLSTLGLIAYIFVMAKSTDSPTVDLPIEDLVAAGKPSDDASRGVRYVALDGIDARFQAAIRQGLAASEKRSYATEPEIDAVLGGNPDR